MLGDYTIPFTIFAPISITTSSSTTMVDITSGARGYIRQLISYCFIITVLIKVFIFYITIICYHEPVG